MGTWGAGAFDNDTALDFVDEIQDVEDLVGALSLRTPDDPVDFDTGVRIVVVAECVAAMRGHPARDLPPELGRRLAGFGAPSKSLYHHSRDHLAAVASRGELMELWAESGAADWNRAMHDLLARMNRPPGVFEAPATPTFVNEAPCSFCDQVMGEEEMSRFEIDLDHGSFRMKRHGWAHPACLNAALHPKHNLRVYAMNGEDLPEGGLDALDTLLEQPPSAQD